MLNINELWCEKEIKPYKGLFIVVSGFDGSGKTTQVNLLKDYFCNEGYEITLTFQPSTFYRKNPLVRKFLKEGGSVEEAKALCEMAAKDRIQHLNDLVIPDLEKGKIVICDRYIYDSIALFLHRGLDIGFILSVNMGILKPDNSFYLDVPPATLRSRINERDKGVFKFEETSEDKILSIVKHYHQMGNNLSIIDGTKKRDEILKRMLEEIKRVSIS